MREFGIFKVDVLIKEEGKNEKIDHLLCHNSTLCDGTFRADETRRATGSNRDEAGILFHR